MLSFVVLFCLFCLSCGQFQNCQVSGITLATQVSGIGLNYSTVLSHMQNTNITFVNASTHFLACVDGRSENGILGTPGGDTGEFLAALATFISLGGSVASPQNVSKFLDDIISLETIQRAFYMHSDDHALETLKADLQGIVPNFTIYNVSSEYQSIVLDELVKPSHIGCGHLRSVLTSPVDYQLDSNITKWYIRAFFDFMWNGYSIPKVSLHFPDYEVLHYNHSERAVLNVYTDITNAGRCAAAAPLVAPRSSASSLFVNHPTFVGPIRRELSHYFSRHLNISSSIFRTRMDAIAASQLNQTLARLAPGFSIYGVTIKVTEISSTTSTVPNLSTSTTSVAQVATTGSVKVPPSDDHLLAPLIVIFVLVIIAIVAGGSYYLYKRRKTNSGSHASTPRKEEDVVQLEAVDD